MAAKGQGDEDVKLSLKEALEKTVDTNAEYLMKVMEVESGRRIQQGRRAADVQQYPGAALALIDAYRLAITEGRSGN